MGLTIQAMQFAALDEILKETKDLPALSTSEFSKDKSIVELSRKSPELPNSSINQIKDYGILRRRQNFHYLDLVEIPFRITQALEAALQSKAPQKKLSAADKHELCKSILWREQDGYFRRFQDWLTPIKHKIVFNYTGNEVRPSVQACVVLPELLSDKVVEKLGLFNLKQFQGRGRTQKIAEKKADVAVLKTLKTIWDSTRTLAPDNFRMLVVTAPNPADLKLANPEHKLPKHVEGSLIVSSKRQHPLASSKSPRLSFQKQLKVQVFKSAYDAVRKTKHVDQRYAFEIEALSELKADFQTFRTRADRGWKPGMHPEVRADFLLDWAVIVEKSEDLLKRSVDPKKKEAFAQLEKIAKLTDSSGKLNISSSMVVMTSIISRLEGRFSDTRPIGGFNKQDQIILRSEIRSQETALQRFCSTIVTSANNILSRYRLELLGSERMSPSQIDASVKGFMSRLRADPQELERVNLRPFLKIAKALKLNYRRLETALAERNRPKVEKVLQQFAHIETHIANLLEAEHAKIAAIRPK